MRRLLLLTSSVCTLLASAAAAQEPALQPQVHVVNRGDTLWDLARRYLSDPFLWPEIFEANRDVVSDPHWIYPQERLLIPGLSTPIVADATRVRAAVGRTVFYGGELSATRPAVSVVAPVAAEEVPVVQPGSFYAAGLLVPDSAVAAVGRLVELVSPTVVPRRAEPQIQPYDKVYMTLSAAVEPGTRLHLMRRGRAVEPYGRVYSSTGTARVLTVDGGVATIEVEKMYDQVAVGDIALAMPEFVIPEGVRPADASGLEGVLLAFEPEQALAAREDVAFVNLGRASGVVEGDEFMAYIPGTRAEWGTRPAVDVARVQVIRAGPLTSAVRVVELEYPALEEGLPVRLVAKMP